MIKRFSLVSMVFLAVFLFSFFSFIDSQTDETVVCPVSGEKILKSEAKGHYEYKGEKYYFCCDGCKDTFIQDPEKYISQKSQSMHALTQGHECSCCQDSPNPSEEKIVDPVCGMELNKEDAAATYTYKDKAYFFCMDECKDKFAEAPEKYIKAGEEMVVCQVTGKKVKKSDAVTYDYEGKNYFFCCENCRDKFKDNPNKYIE